MATQARKIILQLGTSRVYPPSLKISACGLPPAFGHPVDEERGKREREREGGGLIKICIYFNSSQSVEMADWMGARDNAICLQPPFRIHLGLVQKDFQFRHKEEGRGHGASIT